MRKLALLICLFFGIFASPVVACEAGGESREEIDIAFAVCDSSPFDDPRDRIVVVYVHEEVMRLQLTAHVRETLRQEGDQWLGTWVRSLISEMRPLGEDSDKMVVRMCFNDGGDMLVARDTSQGFVDFGCPSLSELSE
jgi:hypothetical protein